ncbi:MAG TPA: MEDS domain-containing protein [Candidatus Saccharimonadales bacterium]
MNIASALNALHNPTGQNHISLFYDSSAQRLQFLGNYLQVGFERNELCVVVSHASQKELIADLKSVGLDVAKQIRQKDLRVFNARKTYLTGDSFVVEYMLNNVINFTNDARAQGYNGLRTAGEMNWLTEQPHAHDDAATYESEVNGIKAQSFTGLCLYPIDSSSVQAIKSAVRTHPDFAYKNTLHHNPYYFEPHEYAEVQKNNLQRNASLWLNNLEEFEQKHSPRTVELSDQAIKKVLLSAGH